MTLKESTAQDTALAAKASPQVPDQGGDNDGKKQHSKAFLVLAAMGPGIVTAMAGNDAGGISTYSTVGAKFGYMTLWIIPRHVHFAYRGANHGNAHGRCYRQGVFGADP